MEKTLAERILEDCQGQQTPKVFLQAKADMLIEAEEMVTGQWTSSYESKKRNVFRPRNTDSTKNYCHNFKIYARRRSFSICKTFQ